MRKWRALTQPTPSTGQVGRSGAEKHTRDSTRPEGGMHSSHREREQRGNFLTWTPFFQFLRDPESEIQRRVNEMDKAGPPTFHFSLTLT